MGVPRELPLAMAPLEVRVGSLLAVPASETLEVPVDVPLAAPLRVPLGARVGAMLGFEVVLLEPLLDTAIVPEELWELRLVGVVVPLLAFAADDVWVRRGEAVAEAV